MFFHRKSYVSLTTLMIVLVALTTGITFGSVAGYVVGNVVASRTQPVVEAIANPGRLELEPVVMSSQLKSAPEAQRHVISEEYSNVQAVNMVLPTVVTVINQGGEEFGSGSGFFISSEGYLVTNNHVTENAETLTVIYAEGGTAPATLVGAAPQFDLAVLRVDGPVPAVAQWGDSADLPLGTNVVAIGSALGRFQNSVTAGVVSGFNRNLGGLHGLLQTDAAINQGNSGGPLINLGAEVIGINTLVFRGGLLQSEGLGFAIPSNLARPVVRQIIEKGEVKVPFLGIQYQTLYQGILIKDILQDTPASEAGLQAGDILLAVDGQPLDSQHPLASLLLGRTIGDRVTLELLRDDEIVERSLTLEERE